MDIAYGKYVGKAIEKGAPGSLEYIKYAKVDNRKVVVFNSGLTYTLPESLYKKDHVAFLPLQRYSVLAVTPDQACRLIDRSMFEHNPHKLETLHCSELPIYPDASSAIDDSGKLLTKEGYIPEKKQVWVKEPWQPVTLYKYKLKNGEGSLRFKSDGNNVSKAIVEMAKTGKSVKTKKEIPYNLRPRIRKEVRAKQVQARQESFQERRGAIANAPDSE